MNDLQQLINFCAKSGQSNYKIRFNLPYSTKEENSQKYVERCLSFSLVCLSFVLICYLLRDFPFDFSLVFGIVVICFFWIIAIKYNCCIYNHLSCNKCFTVISLSCDIKMCFGLFVWLFFKNEFTSFEWLNGYFLCIKYSIYLSFQFIK